MGLGKKVYFDTNIFIYMLEDLEPMKEYTERLLSRIEEQNSVIFTSELTIAECLVKPKECGNLELERIYLDQLTQNKNISLQSIDRKILIEASRIRAEEKLKLPDSIHMATALHCNCNHFITNDKKIRSALKPQIVHLNDV